MWKVAGRQRLVGRDAGKDVATAMVGGVEMQSSRVEG